MKMANQFASNTLKGEDDERWVRFRDHFLNLQNVKESTALGDIYILNEDKVVQAETNGERLLLLRLRLLLILILIMILLLLLILLNNEWII